MKLNFQRCFCNAGFLPVGDLHRLCPLCLGDGCVSPNLPSKLDNLIERGLNVSNATKTGMLGDVRVLGNSDIRRLLCSGG